MLSIIYLFGVLARYAVANTMLLAYLANSDVGLGNVDNTADSAKNVRYANSAGSASSATKATQDSSNQTITSTYIKSLSVSGRTITYTRGDNTSGSITTQDTNTTYNVGTSTYSGTTKLYTTTGSNTDGTMTQKAITSTYSNIPSNVMHTYIGIEIRLPNNTDTTLAALICRLRSIGYYFGKFVAMSFPEFPVQSWGYLVQYYFTGENLFYVEFQQSFHYETYGNFLDYSKKSWNTSTWTKK